MMPKRNCEEPVDHSRLCTRPENHKGFHVSSKIFIALDGKNYINTATIDWIGIKSVTSRYPKPDFNYRKTYEL